MSVAASSSPPSRIAQTPFLHRVVAIDPRLRFPVAAAALFGLGFLPPAFGSLATLLFFLLAALALFAIVRQRGFRFDPAVRFAAAACAVYFGLDVLSFLYPDPAHAWIGPVKSLQFGLFPLVVAGLAGATGYDPLRCFVGGTRAGAIAGAVVAATQMFDGIERAYGGMINPIPFGSVSLLFAFVALIGVREEGWRGRAFAIAAFAAGLGASLVSQSRGGWLAAPLLGIILLVYFRARFGNRATAIAVAILAAIAALVLIVARDQVTERLEQTVAMFTGYREGVESDDVSTLAQRALMMEYGLEAVADRPLLGYGPQNFMTEIRVRAGAEGETIMEYDHLHNEFLTETAANGIVGLVTLLLVLAAPIVTALRAPRDDRYADRLALAAMFVAGPVVFGMTNLAFGHDIMNSVYVSGLLAVGLSAIQSRRKAAAARPAADDLSEEPAGFPVSRPARRRRGARLR